MTSTPVPITATVTPPPLRAPRCAAASMPRASPLMTTPPARAGSRRSCSATASPYGEGRREPTIATRGPSGGGHLPRALRWGSGGDILEPEAERLEDVVLFDFGRAVEVGCRAGHTPGAMEATRRESALGGPALERPARSQRERGQLAEACRLELRVEAALAVGLAEACGEDALAHDG